MLPHEQPSSIGDWIEQMSKTGDSNSQGLFETLLWTAWYARNEGTHNHKVLDHHWCFSFADRRLLEHKEGKIAHYQAEKKKLAAQWTRLSVGFLKLNVDASIVQGTGTKIGVVFRDLDGQIITTLTRFYPDEMVVEVAEAIACRDGVSLAKNLSYVGNVIADIFDIISSFDSFIPSYVRRIGNNVAHLFARYAFSASSNEPTIGIIPEHVLRAANLEASVLVL
ncbi:hypothetical protein DH2020_027431 [Rehmannia glutinosa]|uniref:RNase H type-1 domain-containing protein n=1 Tax=Rehmannia glutinosa TaxID=99300 RepID=A0ABR0VU79_REHGL